MQWFYPRWRAAPGDGGTEFAFAGAPQMTRVVGAQAAPKKKSAAGAGFSGMVGAAPADERLSFTVNTHSESFGTMNGQYGESTLVHSSLATLSPDSLTAAATSPGPLI